MATWRATGFSLTLVTISALSMGLSGCGDSPTSGPVEAVKQTPAVNEKGETVYSLDNESKPPVPAAKK